MKSSKPATFHSRYARLLPSLPALCPLFPAIVLFIAAPLSAATFYLSPSGSDETGMGSRQRPWRTIAQAVRKVPDDSSTIVLTDGLYEAFQAVDRQFTKTYTVRAEHPYRARLRSPAGRNPVIGCYDTANLTFQGLEIFGSGGTRGEYVVQVTTAKTHHVVFEDCIIHDSYYNDLVKINDFAHQIAFRGCLVFNQPDHGGDQHFDINTLTDVEIDGCILFNDYAGSGRPTKHRSQGFIVVKNSGSESEVTRRIALRRSIFLNYDGAPDEAFVLLGEDGKPFVEAQDVMIENNLFIHNSPVQSWGTLLYKGGLKNVTFRANTVVGHPAVKWTGAMSAVCIRVGKNPSMGDLTFANNIFSDPTGQMPRFSISDAKIFAPGSKQVLLNNLYWNAGKAIPSHPQDVLAPERDAKRIVADPLVGAAERGSRTTESGAKGAGVILPRWDAKKGAFLSGQKTIRGEFKRLVRLYGTPAAGSPAIGAADPSCMPPDDILGRPRKTKPDIGCVEQQAGNPGTAARPRRQ